MAKEPPKVIESKTAKKQYIKRKYNKRQTKMEIQKKQKLNKEVRIEREEIIVDAKEIENHMSVIEPNYNLDITNYEPKVTINSFKYFFNVNECYDAMKILYPLYEPLCVSMQNRNCFVNREAFENINYINMNPMRCQTLGTSVMIFVSENNKFINIVDLSPYIEKIRNSKKDCLNIVKSVPVINNGRKRRIVKENPLRSSNSSKKSNSDVPMILEKISIQKKIDDSLKDRPSQPMKEAQISVNTGNNVNNTKEDISKEVIRKTESIISKNREIVFENNKEVAKKKEM